MYSTSTCSRCLRPKIRSRSVHLMSRRTSCDRDDVVDQCQESTANHDRGPDHFDHFHDIGDEMVVGHWPAMLRRCWAICIHAVTCAHPVATAEGGAEL